MIGRIELTTGIVSPITTALTVAPAVGTGEMLKSYEPLSMKPKTRLSTGIDTQYPTTILGKTKVID
jgi:hypothetical protein